jgi:hypothetical protein
MHLFMAREMVDKHLEVAGAMVDPDKGASDKLAALPKIASFYAWWYPTRWLGWGRWPRYAEFGRLAPHLRFVERGARKLARESFHGMMRYQAKLQNKQAFLFRLVDVANELFAMASSVTRAEALRRTGAPEAREATDLADVFCRISRRRIGHLFRELWSNDDDMRYRTAMDVLKGRHQWMENGIVERTHEGAVPKAPPASAAPAKAEPKKVAVGVS